MRILTSISFILWISTYCFSQKTAQNKSIETDVMYASPTGVIHGSLNIPSGMSEKIPVVLIIAGSGPTDRNGNNPQMTNNSLKMLADSLAEYGVASLRYDKRGIAGSAAAALSEADLRFEDYVNDASGWVRQLKTDERFSRVIIAGHSEGSLIGMIAASQTQTDAFISLAGAGFRADEILKKQIAASSPIFSETCNVYIDSLKDGHLVHNIHPLLQSLFRKSAQPYLISWFQYDPQQSIRQLKIPVLIIQGTHDIQVDNENGRALYKALPQSIYAEIAGMNHILKEAPADRNENLLSYSKPDLPLHVALIPAIQEFLKAK